MSAIPTTSRPARSTASDGFGNRVERYALTHFGRLWRFAQSQPGLERRLNRLLINRAVAKCPPRPYPLSLMADYTSWDSLTDRTYSGRHLPPADDEFVHGLPKLEDVLTLFHRPAGGARLSDKSAMLFSNFAQWFTDGFLRTYRHDYRQNTSNHEIDLSPLYGRTRTVAAALRANDGTGKLKSQRLPQNDGGEFPHFFFDDDFVAGRSDEPRVRPGFEAVAGEIHLLPQELKLLESPEGRDRMRTRFAMGVERANNHLGYVMLNVLFLREHNRLCDLLKSKHPGWDDDRLYHTARNTVIVTLLRIVVEEYINHISPFHFQLKAQPGSFYKARWYRTNWMTVEFNLLYRWHGLVPDAVDVGGQSLPLPLTLFNNRVLIDAGIGPAIDAASRQAAGEVGLFNTPSYLVDLVEKPSLELARKARLRSYNDYREYAGFPRARRFSEMTGDPDRQKALERVYCDPDRVEFFVGLFAEDVAPNSALPPLVGRLVAVDAFSQALTNPLLSEQVYRPETFAEGWDEIARTSCLGDVVARNLSTYDGPPDGGRPGEGWPQVTMTRPDWRCA